MSCKVLYISDLFCVHGNIGPGNITISHFSGALKLFFWFFVFYLRSVGYIASHKLFFQNWQNWKCLIPRGSFKKQNYINPLHTVVWYLIFICIYLDPCTAVLFVFIFRHLYESSGTRVKLHENVQIKSYIQPNRARRERPCLFIAIEYMPFCMFCNQHIVFQIPHACDTV